MEVSVRRMSDPSLGKRRSSNPLVGLDGSAAQQLMIPLGEGELGLTITNNAHGKGVVVSALSHFHGVSSKAEFVCAAVRGMPPLQAMNAPAAGHPARSHLTLGRGVMSVEC